MSFRNTLLPLNLLLLLLLLPVLSHAEDARFLTIVDGDSMVVEYGGRSHKIRLIGIDAPEWGQEYGVQAKVHALDFCYGKALRLEFDRERKDRYGRELAYVYCDDRMLNEELVSQGLAITIAIKPNTKYYRRLKSAEARARKARNGFWLHGGLRQTPAQWRKTHKK